MADELVALAPGTRVSGRWTILKKLGAGAFGAVYLCKDGKGTVAALKTEPIDTRQPLLVMEATVLDTLGKKLKNADGQHFCRLLDLGRSEQRNATSGDTVFNYVVMTVVGTPLDKLIRNAGDRFSPGTAIGMSIQLLSAIKALHNVGFLHRDIKPANTAIGRAETNEHRLLYLIDFGMARQFLRPDGTQRRPRAFANFRGTPIYGTDPLHISRVTTAAKMTSNRGFMSWSNSTKVLSPENLRMTSRRSEG
uniref:Probable protein kinase Hgg-20 n=1 Tax=Heterodera glycines TaxID=51029 RepID=Q8TA41_HETGL|nr:probable protein kinase Hgg-20 [Heterodera glycines]